MKMSKNPVDAEDRQDKTVRYKHEDEFHDDAASSPHFEKDRMPWYFRTSFIVFAVACVGPLALPLIWWRPATRRAWKIGLTIGILLLSWFLFQATVESIRVIREYVTLLDQL